MSEGRKQNEDVSQKKGEMERNRKAEIVISQHMIRWVISYSCWHISEHLSVNPRGVTFLYIAGLHMCYRDHP